MGIVNGSCSLSSAQHSDGVSEKCMQFSPRHGPLDSIRGSYIDVFFRVYAIRGLPLYHAVLYIMAQYGRLPYLP